MASEQLLERMKEESGRYMTTEEVMALYHVTSRTVYRWRDAGRIHSVRAGRRLLFERVEVEALASDL